METVPFPLDPGEPCVTVPHAADGRLRGRAMTVDQAISVNEVRPCPAWCTCCTPAAEGGFGHLGDDREIGLSLMAPATGEDFLHGVPYYEPAELVVSLALVHGACVPYVTISTKHLELDCGEFRLSYVEAVGLVEILKGLISEGRAGLQALQDGCE